MTTNTSWKIGSGLAGAAAGWVTRAALRAVWRKAKDEQPPENPASPNTTWPDALLWAIGSGVAISVTRLVAQRGVAGAWHAATGSFPTDVVESGSAA